MREDATGSQRSQSAVGNILDALDEGIVGVDRAGRVLAINRAASRLVAVERESAIGSAVGDVVRLLDEKTGEPLDLQAAAMALERRAIVVDERGRRALVAHRRVPLHGADGSVDGSVLRFRRLDASEAASSPSDPGATSTEAQRARLAAIVDSSDDAIVGKTLTGIVTSWNAGAVRVFGYEPHEIIGRSITALIPPGREQEEVSILERLGRGERIAHFRTVRLRKDGREIHVAITSSAVRDASGALIGASKVARDITDQVRAEEDLARAKDAAEAANRELEAFSYSVAHDLRAPLRGMSGFARVLLEGYRDRLDAEGQDWLQEIVVNAQKMAALIDALLSLARLNRSELRYARVDLSAMAREVADQLVAADVTRDVEWNIEPRMTAMLDPSLARALVGNLLGNAWKFTSKCAAARRACIEVGTTELEGRRVFFVRDNGAGFDMAFADKLFGPFQRLHTTEEFPGTGIGLATVQRIVRRHGGRVWAEGSVDGGATFYFAFNEAVSGSAP